MSKFVYSEKSAITVFNIFIYIYIFCILYIFYIYIYIYNILYFLILYIYIVAIYNS